MYEFDQDQQFDYENDQLREQIAGALDLISATEIDFEIGTRFDSLQDYELDQAAQDLESIVREIETNALAQMGRCPCNFKWRPEGAGYRCLGGSHFVNKDEIAKYLKVSK